MDSLRRYFSTVRRCRKAVWKSVKKNFLLSCFRCRRTSMTKRRTTEDILDGVMAAVADNSTINANISATTIDISCDEQLLVAVNSSKTEEEKELLKSVTQDEAQPRNIMDEAEEKKKTVAAQIVLSVSPGDEEVDGNESAGRSEQPELDSEYNGQGDNCCPTETAPATPTSSVPLMVERVNNHTAEGSKTRKSVDNYKEEAKGERTSRLSKSKSMCFAPEMIRPGDRHSRQSSSVGSGLTNKGVICYINSTLQALFHVPAFTDWLMNDTAHRNACRRDADFENDCIVCAVRKTFILSQRLTGSSFKASMITDRLSLICEDLSTNRQEDAHEFLCYLIRSMEQNCLSVSGHADGFPVDVYSKEITLVSQIFGGYIRTEVTCGECANRSVTYQYLQDLILDIKRSDNISDALKDYFESEQLLYACNICQREVIAEKKYLLGKAPNVLCVQLKRYDDVCTEDGYYSRKISKAIEINERLELSNYVQETDAQPLRYHLVSMVMHHGTSLDSGHYTAVCLTPTGSYYYFNDKNVYQTSFDKYSKSEHSYLLFYELDSLKRETAYNS